ncbi:hypothetical protein BBO99_00006733 [Phytophthora kernoviae]|uniref:PFU domain-containing protein n=2 Tax=Phytophthora kernoviae TaxID=325452 RepID=A0A3R7NDK6_9STRA|nr:hypothetical protein G195_007450 [Phytophthora kernoviae 00238/432]KAG2521269.1 hypothetical protein JM16_006231 [Phytophthora kernoviae]KAG2522411.1 hypothetical protein JM18_006168 [Phytophthora kernoviae]RLN31370.1 hypothetical protein BBI17_006755 [Phytophthora kernoviae]RLN77461.1 hypothetical protein BBO99_00006733 [Phytophthora kernoviae]
MPITIDGTLKNLQLLRGESFEDAATAFARSNGLMAATDDPKVQAVVDQLSGLLKDKMQEVEVAEASQETPKETLPSVQLSMPLTIDGYTGDLLKYETETPEAAVERFLNASGFSMDIMREVYPQLVTLVNRKLEELQPPRRELFAFTLSLDGRELIVRHFENGIPMDEAVETLRGIGLSDGEFMDRVAPQIANQIVNEIANRQHAAATSAQAAGISTQEAPQQATEPGSQQQPPQRREMFSEPLTLNNQPAIMIHYEGSTARETAMRFLSENGINDDATINTLVPQLVDIVDNQANLDYYEGDNVEATAQRFLVGVGLGQSELFNDNVVQLSALVRKNLADLEQQQAQASLQEQVTQPTQPEPLFVLPVTLSGNIYNLEYFEGQEPNYAANKFCVEKHETVRAELGVDFDGDQLLACQNVLVTSIRNILEERQQSRARPEQQTEAPVKTQGEKQGEAKTEGQAPAVSPKQTEPEAPVNPRGILLFTLDLDMGDGTSIQLPFHRNDSPKELAAAFCTKNKLDQENAPALVDAMEAQLKELKEI